MGEGDVKSAECIVIEQMLSQFKNLKDLTMIIGKFNHQFDLSENACLTEMSIEVLHDQLFTLPAT